MVCGILDKLSRLSGIVGTIFLKAQTEIEDPAKLRRLVALIDGENWIGLGVDTKGAIYEGLLERNAAEVKSGAGQYFTPRPLIDAMVTVIDPEPRETIHDPACGTGGFLLAAWEHMRKNPLARKPSLSGDAHEVFRRRHRARGGAAVRHEPLPARLPAPTARSSARDALLGDAATYDVVLTNPPFGRKQGYKIVGDDGEIETEREEYNRPDFIKTHQQQATQFPSAHHVDPHENGRCAVVLPDNVLFEGGAGAEIRKRPPRQLRFPHAVAAADRHLLQAGRQGQRAVLRPQAGVRKAWTQGPVDLRLANQPALHPEGAADEARRPRRFRRLLLRRQSARSARRASASAASPMPI